MNAKQQGSALISVLIILLVITVLGVIAIRQGLTSLNIATSTQAQAIMFQSADYGIDQVYVGLDTQAEVLVAQSAFGIIGLPQITGNEVVTCLRAGKSLQQIFIDQNAIAQNRVNASFNLENLDVAGYCDVTNSTDFNSGRMAALTQIALSVPIDADKGEAFSTAITGTDNDVLFGSNTANATNTQSKPVRLRTYSTTVIPALSQSADSATINGCLKSLNDTTRAKDANNAETVTDCLTKNAVPFSTHTEEYLMRPKSTRDRNS
jgi:hypothetical protein